MNDGGGYRALCRGLLAFWSLWFGVVFASNAADALQQLGWLATDAGFVSGNYSLIVRALSVYAPPAGLAAALFAAVIALQLASALLFAHAALAEPSPARTIPAFATGLGLFGGFLLADEILLVYRELPGIGGTHLGVFVALLASLLVVSRAR